MTQNFEHRDSPETNADARPDVDPAADAQDETRAFSAQDDSDAPTRVVRRQDAGSTSDRSSTDGLDIPTYTAPTYTAPDREPAHAAAHAEPRYVAPSEPDRRDDADGLLGEPQPLEEVVPLRRGTTDLGLLLLRVGLGVVIGGHGLQKVFGLFNGPGIDGFRQLLDTSGYRYADVLTYVGSITELVAGVLLVLGFLTPIAAAAALGTTINAWFVADLANSGFVFFVGNGGQELEMLLVVLAAAVAFTGPGRYSLDGRRGWASRPRASSWLSAVVGIAAGLVVWFLLNGTIPFALQAG